MKIQRMLIDHAGDMFIREISQRLARSIRYVHSIVEEFGFVVVRMPGRVGGWIVGEPEGAGGKE
jgi:hypothetical protein